MKLPCLYLNSILIASAIMFSGCATAPKTVKVSAQILVTDAGKVQKTGLAPVWIYDATNAQLTAQFPLPKFGGRSRQDWQRITTAFPNSLNVYSNYAALDPLGPQAEVKRIAANAEYYKMKDALNGQTNGPAFDAVQRQELEVKRLLAEENKLWDAADDARELIVLWYNLNPGLLYAAGLPAPLATAQTDKKGNFNFTLPAGKSVLIAAHIEGTVDGQPGNYFWLLPFNAGIAATNAIVLTGDNASCKHTKPQMPPVMLPEANGYIGNVGFWMLNRARDARQSYEPPTQSAPGNESLRLSSPGTR